MSRVLGVLLLLLCSASAGAVQVRASGAVTHPGVLELHGAARLSDAALAAQPLPQAYVLGAAWLRPGLLVAQQRLKAGVLFDLGQLQQRSHAGGHKTLADAAAAIKTWVTAMPVTGRQPASLLDPRAVEIDPAANLLLAPGDRLYYPLRPATIDVVGAVAHTCTLPLLPLQDARLYLAACAASSAADRDSIYVIEPDGRVFVQGIALWNRSAPLALAPGALIYVPLREAAASAIDTTMNHDIAAFLATQLLPGPGVN
jgi:hypothetical protein